MPPAQRTLLVLLDSRNPERTPLTAVKFHRRAGRTRRTRTKEKRASTTYLQLPFVGTSTECDLIHKPHKVPAPRHGPACGFIRCNCQAGRSLPFVVLSTSQLLGRDTMPPAHACEGCKRRKVKCDGVEPCANCRISRLPCGYKTISKRRSRGNRRVPEHHPSPACDLDPECIVEDVRYGHIALVVSSPGCPQSQLEEPEQIRRSLPSPDSASVSDHSRRENSLVLGFHLDARQIHSTLLRAILVLLGTESVQQVAHDCIDFFVQYLFPNTPIAHEPTLRAAATLLTVDGFSAVSGSFTATQDVHQQVPYLRGFALITALCAFVTSVMPAPPPSQMNLLSRPFLSASRATLQIYEEYDLENPDSTSLVIRMWHSAAMQNTTGRVGTSHQYHAEAAVLARRLRLHNEASVRQHSKIESRLLRASFWLLYLADKTAIAFESRPPILHEAALGEDFTLLDNDEHDESLLDNSRNMNQDALEIRLFVGFHLKRRIWAAAADLLSEIKLLSRRTLQGGVQSEKDDDKMAQLTEGYILFTSLTDQLPPWLRNPDRCIESDEEEVVAYQKNCFWTQRSNIMTVFHCMRLVILQKCADSGLVSVFGLSNQAISCALHKIEIVRDFLHELQVVPFFCFKVQGETAVSSNAAKSLLTGRICLMLL
jgi:hypothetical protein